MKIFTITAIIIVYSSLLYFSVNSVKEDSYHEGFKAGMYAIFRSIDDQAKANGGKVTFEYGIVERRKAAGGRPPEQK